MALSSSTIMGKDTLKIDSFSSYQNTNYKLHFFFFADFVIFAIQVSRDAPHLTNKKVQVRSLTCLTDRTAKVYFMWHFVSLITNYFSS